MGIEGMFELQKAADSVRVPMTFHKFQGPFGDKSLVLLWKNAGKRHRPKTTNGDKVRITATAAFFYRRNDQDILPLPASAKVAAVY